jgi:hypothetical protein
MFVFVFIRVTYITVTDLITELLGNSSVNTFQRATIEAMSQ